MDFTPTGSQAKKIDDRRFIGTGGAQLLARSRCLARIHHHHHHYGIPRARRTYMDQGRYSRVFVSSWLCFGQVTGPRRASARPRSALRASHVRARVGEKKSTRVRSHNGHLGGPRARATAAATIETCQKPVRLLPGGLNPRGCPLVTAPSRRFGSLPPLSTPEPIVRTRPSFARLRLFRGLVDLGAPSGRDCCVMPQRSG